VHIAWLRNSMLRLLCLDIQILIWRSQVSESVVLEPTASHRAAPVGLPALAYLPGRPRARTPAPARGCLQDGHRIGYPSAPSLHLYFLEECTHRSSIGNYAGFYVILAQIVKIRGSFADLANDYEYQ